MSPLPPMNARSREQNNTEIKHHPAIVRDAGSVVAFFNAACNSARLRIVEELRNGERRAWKPQGKSDRALSPISRFAALQQMGCKYVRGVGRAACAVRVGLSLLCSSTKCYAYPTGTGRLCLGN